MAGISASKAGEKDSGVMCFFISLFLKGGICPARNPSSYPLTPILTSEPPFADNRTAFKIGHLRVPFHAFSLLDFTG